MTNKRVIIEDASSLFDSGLSAKELFERKTALARVLKEVEDALSRAEDAGNDTLADKLRAKAEYLQELLDLADETDYEPDAPSAEEKKGGEDEGGEEKKSKDKEDDDDGDDDDDRETSPKDPPKNPPPPTESPEPAKNPPPPPPPRKPPFSPPPPPPYPPEPPPPPPPPPPEEDPFEAAKRILSGLTSTDAKNGASKGLKELLAKLGAKFEESLNDRLNEAITKTISQMSQEEFNNELAAAMELVDEIKEVSYSDDLEGRVKEIKRDFASRAATAALEKEDSDFVRKDKEAMKAFDGERKKLKKYKPLSGMEAFKATLYRAISEQVAEYEEEEDSWAALDRRHEDDPSILKKGIILDDKYDGDKPSINVYFDQSGSWDDDDIKVGMRALSVINEFVERNELNLNIFYMSAGGVFTTAAQARAFPAAEGWHAAIQHIRESKAKNVIVLSDSHLDSPHFAYSNRPTGDNGKTYIDGCTWWLWRDGSRSPKATEEVIGRTANFEYILPTS
jgi:hypothetical protein